LCARDLTRTQATVQRIGGTAEKTVAVACDVSKGDQVQQMVQRVMEKFGRVDILVNNAGFGLNDSAEKMDISQLRQMFDTNYFGVMECMQAVIPIMRRQGSGDIVNISSVSGHIAVPYMSGYGASKHALQALGMASRLELLRYGINVLTVCPGYIATDFAKNMLKGSNPERVGASVKYGVGPDVVARDTLNGLLKRKRQVVTPWYYWLVIKLYQNAPGLVERAIRRNMKPTSQVIAEAAKKSS
ncbi:MAG TPA: SDR family NAD(P)-dependent oxidoreductase, partial [Candidatus Angelobacter sp.]|nr:SDR family NAD(P)-dependent oxidoreductase [Candidatus Angelobacter sp.]